MTEYVVTEFMGEGIALLRPGVSGVHQDAGPTSRLADVCAG